MPKIDPNNIVLDRSDLDSLHDTLFNALDIYNISDKQLKSVWDVLPMDIKYEALQWGMSDTVVRDNIYVWILENTNEVSKLIKKQK